MDARCYGASKKTVRFHKSKVKVLDVITTILIIGFCVFVCVDRWYLRGYIDIKMGIKGLLIK